MPGNIEAQAFLLVLKGLPSVPIGNIGQGLFVHLLLFSSERDEHVDLARLTIALRRLGALQSRIQRSQHLCPARVQCVKGAAFDELFEYAAVHLLSIHAFDKIIKRLKRPLFFTAADDAFNAASPTFFTAPGRSGSSRSPP